MSNPRTVLFFLSVLLAVAMPLLLAGKAKINLSSGDLVYVKITPYDPRDLLRGHYMRFQIDWNWQTLPEMAQGGNQCLCIGPGKDNPPVTLERCEVASQKTPSCVNFIKGEYMRWGNSARFTTGIERFYVDEKQARSLERDFNSKKHAFTLGLVLRKNGKPVIEQLYIDGTPLPDYLKSRP